ncbi:MAG: indolepyruvate ferredoxin oxidoreductase [Syntrophorhabdaceae bacterium PtaU1.Bin034]|nr:MAG: indolepyruvate ferredoxin oxidoreductase [Syntrophorhabdaceae bacterium PtaU1.Bin034]
MGISEVEVMIGNQAIALGLVEAGIDLAAAYPGTPSSEILPAVTEFKKRLKRDIHIEWSVNERVAMEVAFGAAMAGKKAVCMMKQVGLNVAFPPFIKGREAAIRGGLLIVSCDDPGPQSSQTEQDSRLIGTLFGVPVFDAPSPVEARLLASHAMSYSVMHKIPVILRSTHRVSHAREAICLDNPATEKTARLDDGLKTSGGSRFGIVASGMTYNVIADVLSDLGMEEAVSLYKVVRIFPFSNDLFEFARSIENLLVVEETDEVLEALIGDRTRVFGRKSGHVPRQGELTYDVMRGIVQKVAGELGIPITAFSADTTIEAAISTVSFPQRPPRLCAGCPHRASFYAMRQAFPKAVFPGDIGCYTLGISQGAVDTCLDMGSSVGLAAGFFNTFDQDGASVSILASIGDSTFFHAALPLLYDAVRKGGRFIIIIMDNGTTAMTGMQPTPQSGMRAEGAGDHPIPIEHVVKGLGAEFLKIIDPYDIPGMIRTIREAETHLKQGGKGPAVVIARRPCLLFVKAGKGGLGKPVDLTTDCTGCRRCVDLFGCPGFRFDESEQKVRLDEALCVSCGVCLFVCPQKTKGKGRRAGEFEKTQ